MNTQTTRSNPMHRSPRLLAALAGLALVAGATSTTHAQNWAAPDDGVWSVMSNWDPMVVPNGMQQVVLGHSKPYTATLNYNISFLDALFIAPTATMAIGTNVTASFNGLGLGNAGTILVNPEASGFVSQIALNTDQAFSGDGRVVLNASSGSPETARFVRGSADPLLSISMNHVIEGTGSFSDIRVFNTGTVDANVPSRTLQFTGARAVTNAGEMKATAGLLLFSNSQVTQQFGGSISAIDPGRVRLQASARIVGGELQTDANGDIGVADSHTAIFGSGDQTGPTNNGSFSVNTNASLVLENSFTNLGTITVNPNASGFVSNLIVNTDLTIQGTGTIVFNANVGNNATARFIRGGTDPLLTLGAGQTVRGHGLFNDIRVVNNGTVIADRDGLPLAFNGNRAVTNNATLSAINGGRLVFSTTQLVSGPGGQINIGDNSSALLENSASLVSGTVTITGSGVLAVANNNTAFLGNPTLNGPLHVRDNASLQLTTSFTNLGTITVNPNASGFVSNLIVNTDLTIQGTGTIVFNANVGNNATARFIRGGTDPLLTLGAGQTVRGHGLFNDIRVVNNGTVIADRDGLPLAFNGNRAVTNNATLSAINGGRLVFDNTQLTNGATGLISAGDQSQVLMNNSARIVSGATTSTGSGVFALMGSQNGFLSQVTLGAPFEVRENASLYLEGPITLNSTLTVNSPGSGFVSNLFITTDLTISGSGTLLLNANPGNLATGRINRPGGSPTLTVGPQATLAGLGNIENIPLIMQGTISPGGHAGGAVGQLNATGSSTIVMAPTARAVFQIGGPAPSQFDRLTSATTIALGGTLRLELVNGYSPTANTTFQIISAASVSGGFQGLEFGPLPPPKTWVVQYLPNGVRVSIGCNPGDIAFTDATPPGDGSLNNGDFQLFIGAFFSAECDGSTLPCNPADIAQTDATPGPDGWVDNGDFQLFVTFFFTAEGCVP
jgi:hypothetical protein